MEPRKNDRGCKTRVRVNMIKNPIVNITDNAAKRAKLLINNNSHIAGLRISISQGGCSGMTYEVN